MSVLIIDDDTEVRGMIYKMLNEEGYEVLEAANGEEGMQIIRSESEIDLVITDIIMPDKEGIETIIEIKQDFSQIKILAISGGGKFGAQYCLNAAKTLGADLTLGKPFVKQELLDTVQVLFE